MENRHHHHSLHSCHLKHHTNPTGGGGGFERYGGFPQLSRIFPPVSSSSSTSSSTDTNIRVKHRFRFHRKWCACILVAVVFVALGSAAGIYFGVQFLSLTPNMEQSFRGSFTIAKGDTFSDELINPDSTEFKERASKYKSIIDSLYSQSLVKNAFLGSEILAFDGNEDGPLKVLFNIHVDTHRIRLDAGDLFITFADLIRNAKGIIDGNLTVDQDSIEIQERSMEFLYLPSTERNLNFGNSDEPSTGAGTGLGFGLGRSNSNGKSKPTTISTTKYTIADPKRESTHTKKTAGGNNGGRLSGDDEKCMPMSVDFCANITLQTHQRNLDAHTINQLQSIVDSQCYPFAAHFLCSFYVSCNNNNNNGSGPKNGQRDKNGNRNQFVEPNPPCKDYCTEFKSHCAHQLPQEIKNKLSCGPEWSGVGSCVTKPGCVEDLYLTGQANKICDGVMDCPSFNDELHCPYCPPGNFHCGAGKQCITPEKKCDGVVDCPNSSDEKSCLTLAPTTEAAGYVHQYFNEGYLFVHDQGKLGKLCVERSGSGDSDTESKILLDNIGSSACELLGFRKVAFVMTQTDTEARNDSKAGSYVRIQDPGSSSEVTFTAGACPSKRVLYVGCNHLECGQRPSHLRKSKGFVSHGDWPWHAMLLRDGVHVCDATLITSQWLLTSDQCFTSQSKARWTVHFGRVRMTSTSPWQQERRVVGMVKSPLGDNLVLIKMASPVIFSDFARHVCLPEEPERKPGLNLGAPYPIWDKPPGKCIRLGWTKQEQLIETTMYQLGLESCPPSPYTLAQNASRTALCFENDSGRDCLRELKIFPGGPIFCQNDDTREWALAGIAPGESRPKCGVEKFRTSSIAGSTEWILKTIEALSTS